MGARRVIAYLYAALGLRAAGRPVDDMHLSMLAAALGLPTDEELFAAIARLAAPAEVMTGGAEGRSPGVPAVEAESPQPAENACYVYCVVPGGEGVSFGPIGLDGSEVYPVLWNDLAAVVHGRARPPAVSKENAAVHQRVVEATMERFGAVIPLSFGHVMAGGDAAVRDWLAASHDELKKKLNMVRGKLEFGVQVIWDPEAVAARLVDERSGLRRLKEEVQKTPGRAQEAKKRLEAALEEEMRTLADGYAREYLEILGGLSTGVKSERLRQVGEGQQMIAHFSCLVLKEGANRLAAALEEHRHRDGVMVKVSGPWPPYSFVA